MESGNGKQGLLIDDRDKYVNEFREGGGIAIKHNPDDVDNTIRQLKELGTNCLTIPTRRRRKESLMKSLADHQRQGKEYLYTSRCCGHHKKKLSVNFDKNVAKCWTCDWRTKNLRRLVRRWGDISHIHRWKDFDADIELGDLDNLFAKEEETSQRIDLPNEFQTLTGRTHLPLQEFP